MSTTSNTGKSLLIVVLRDGEALGTVILALTGVSGGLVTMIDAVTGFRSLSHSIPLFAALTGTNGKKYCKILMTCVEGNDSASRLVQVLAESGLRPRDIGIGEIFSVPLSEAFLVDEFGMS